MRTLYSRTASTPSNIPLAPDGVMYKPALTSSVKSLWSPVGGELCVLNRRISSSDHDPLYRFHQWQANLRVLEVKEIKTVPYVPLSHPFVGRLIGTIRREYLDQTLFWTAADLEDKLQAFQHYFNKHRTHSGLEGRLPEPGEGKVTLNFASYRWKQHCRGLYQTPTAA